MDQQDYWAIAERTIEIQNPITDRKLRLLDDYCEIRDGLKVLDVGCGKAWLMRHWAAKHDIRGTGIETNKHFLRFAREASKPFGVRLSYVEAKALDVRVEPGSYDIVMCLGATFALGGLVESLEWMAHAVRPGGTIVVGDMTLKHRPAVPVREWLPHDTLESIAIIERHGAEVSATITASEADFERYMAHHRQATLTWARENPTHADHAAVLKQSRDEWMTYLRNIRPYQTWTIFVGRRAD